MKTSRLLLATLALLPGALISPALALTVTEPPDFANDAASAATYILDVGSHVFSGQIPFASGDADFFKITIQPGRKVSAVGTNGASGISVPAAPLYAGTYTVSCAPGAVISDVNWSITFTVATAPDYEVNSVGGLIFVTDRSGFGDTLTVSAPGGSTVKFAAPGRTFSLNGAAFLTGDSGSIPYGVGGSVTVNAGAGDDTIVVGGLGSFFPSLTLNGGTGDDTVNFTGDITFVDFNSLNVDLQDDAASPGADSVNVAANVHLTTSESGTITMRCSRSVSLGSGASLTTENGALTVEANQQEPATPGNFVGVNLSGATLSCTGNNFAATTLTVKGRGGDDAGGYQLGVNLDSGAIISGGERVNVNVTGTGGAGAGGVNRGVTVIGAGSMIESTSTTAGSVNVTGTGGPASVNFGIGVSLLNGTIRATGSAPVTVTGTGAGAPGTSLNNGVEMGGAGAAITAGGVVGGNIFVRGIAGPGASIGVSVDAAAISTPAGGGNIEVRTDNLAINSTANITTANAASRVLFQSDSGTLVMDLGGENAPGRLGLSDAKLDRVFTGRLLVYNFAGSVEITAPITRATATNLDLFAVSDGIRAPAAGTDVSLAGGTLTFTIGATALESRLLMPITGATADTGYPRLSVAGGVALNNRVLDLTGTTFAGVAGQTFTVVENDGTDPIVSTFLGLPEGATFAWPGSSLLNARITYSGGSGNDVVLTLVSALQVTNASNSGIGSLRDVLAYAAVKPGADTVTFHPSLSGATILLDTEIVIDDPAAVTVDASSLPSVLTIGGSPNLNRLFSVSSGKTLALLGLRVIGGHGGGATQNGNGNAIANFGTLALTRCTLTANTRASGSGGAILNDGGMLTLTQCTLSGNSTTNGGAIFQTAGSMTLTQCTLAGNTAATVGDGGAIYKQDGAATLTHCTLSGNHAALSGGDGGAINQLLGTLALTHCTVSGNEAEKGGGISNLDGTTTLTHSIVAGNTATGGGPDIRIQDGSISGVGQNIVQGIDIAGGNVGGTFLLVPPLLAPLGDYGGPTQTMALQPGSPARDAAPTSGATSDQRGQPIFGVPDIGAYEAGTPRNYAAWNYETLPAAATLAQRAPASDFDADGRLNVLEYATFTDPAISSGSAGFTLMRTPDGTEARVTFLVRFTSTDLLYELQRSLPGVGPWVTIGDVNLRTSLIHNYGAGVTNIPSLFSIEFRDPAIAGQGKAFYRLQVSVP